MVVHVAHLANWKIAERNPRKNVRFLMRVYAWCNWPSPFDIALCDEFSEKKKLQNNVNLNYIYIIHVEFKNHSHCTKSLSGYSDMRCLEKYALFSVLSQFVYAFHFQWAQHLHLLAICNAKCLSNFRQFPFFPSRDHL